MPLRPLTMEEGVNWPVSSAAVAVTTLNVEPGAYPYCTARLTSGAALSSFSLAAEAGERSASGS